LTDDRLPPRLADAWGQSRGAVAEAAEEGVHEIADGTVLPRGLFLDPEGEVGVEGDGTDDVGAGAHGLIND
jgi:hypothetical protein